MDGRIRDVINWWKSLRDFSILNMINFFEGSDGGLSIFGFGGGIDRVRGVEDGGVGDSIFVGGARGRAVEVFVSSRHDMEVEVREKGGVLIEVCKASGRNARE